MQQPAHTCVVLIYSVTGFSTGFGVNERGFQLRACLQGSNESSRSYIPPSRVDAQ